MAQITISSLPPAPAGTGTGSSQGTDLFPATDVTDTSSASTGTTKKYTLSEIYNFMLHAQGLTTYSAVRVATTLALSASYNNGALGVGATLTNAGVIGQLTIDGVALSVADRVLVKNQASAFENGIYVVTIAGDVSTNWVLTRATDYDNSSEIIQYGVVLSNQGTSNAGILWQQTSAGPFTIGTSAITFDTYTTQSLALPVLPSQGGTGIVNNNASTWTINGAFPFVGTLTGATNVTFPVSGTLATTANTVSSATGTANEVLINGTSGIAQTGALTFTLPQDIGLSSNVQFGTISTGSISGGSPGTLIAYSPTAANGFLALQATANLGNFSGTLTNSAISASRTWTLPDASGTLALINSTSSGYVLLTAASQTINGSLTVQDTAADYNFTVNSANVAGSPYLGLNRNGGLITAIQGGMNGLTTGGNDLLLYNNIPTGGFNFYTVNTGSLLSLTTTEAAFIGNLTAATVTGTNSVAAGSPTGNANNLIISLSPTAASGAFIMRAADSTGNFNGFLQNASMTAPRTWTLPDATGILALSSSTISSIQGTINQVLVNGTSGSPVTGTAITLTTPQDIATTSTPTFALVNLVSSADSYLALNMNSTSVTGSPYIQYQRNGVQLATIQAGMTQALATGGGDLLFYNSGGTNFNFLNTTTGTSNLYLTPTAATFVGALQAASITSLSSVSSGNGPSNVVVSQSTTAGLGNLVIQCGDNAGNFNGIITNSSLSTNRGWTLPDASGTFLLTGNAINSVPSITFSSTSGIIGTTTNNNAAAGSVGEYVSNMVSSTSPISLTALVAANITSILLTAGDWDVCGLVGGLGSTTTTRISGWCSLSSALLPDGALYATVNVSGSQYNVSTPVLRVSIASTTTVYLSILAQGTGTLQGYGSIQARRCR